MTRNRFNQAKQASTSNVSLSAASRAHQLFLEDNDDIDMKGTYKNKNVNQHIDKRNVINKDYCNNNLISSNGKL